MQARVQQDHEAPLSEIVRQLLHNLPVARTFHVTQTGAYGQVLGVLKMGGDKGERELPEKRKRAQQRQGGRK